MLVAGCLDPEASWVSPRLSGGWKHVEDEYQAAGAVRAGEGEDVSDVGRRVEEDARSGEVIRHRELLRVMGGSRCAIFETR
jgi:hypothetical protein